MSLVKIIEGKNFPEIKTMLYQDYGLNVKTDTNLSSLYMILYPKNVTPEFEKLLIENPFLKECNGVLLEKETNKVICTGYPRHIEYQGGKPLENIVWNADPDKMSITKALECTQIRLVNYNDEWIMSTARTLSAKGARWGTSKNFQEYFEEVAKEISFNYQELDKTYAHVFLLQHTDTQMVFKYKQNNIYYLYSKEGEKEVILPELSAKLPMPEKLKNNPNTFLDFYEEYMMVSNPLDKQIEGYVLKDIESGRQVRIIYTVYREARDVRFNITRDNMFYLYLKLKKEGKIKTYLKYYQEDGNKFRGFENDIDDMATEIYVAYCDKFINKTKKMNEINIYYRTLIYKLNGMFLQERNLKMTKNKIREHMNNDIDIEQLAYIHRGFKNQLLEI